MVTVESQITHGWESEARGIEHARDIANLVRRVISGDRGLLLLVNNGSRWSNGTDILILTTGIEINNLVRNRQEMGHYYRERCHIEFPWISSGTDIPPIEEIRTASLAYRKRRRRRNLPADITRPTIESDFGDLMKDVGTEEQIHEVLLALKPHILRTHTLEKTHVTLSGLTLDNCLGSFYAHRLSSGTTFDAYGNAVEDNIPSLIEQTNSTALIEVANRWGQTDNPEIPLHENLNNLLRLELGLKMFLEEQENVSRNELGARLN
jgi:hypothetical protein